MSDFITETTKPSDQPNRFWLQRYLRSSLHRNKNSLKTRLSHCKTTYPPHLERVHVHWVDERVAVKSRHCGEQFVVSEINKTTTPTPTPVSRLPGCCCCDTQPPRMRGSGGETRHRRTPLLLSNQSDLIFKWRHLVSFIGFS